MGWKCTRCPSCNDDDTKFVCSACGYLDEARKVELACSTSDLPLPPGPWACGACTMENPETAHTCFVCGTADEGRRKKLEGTEGGSVKSLTPEILARAARDEHSNLIGLLIDLCQTMAIGRAALEAGIGRTHLDPAYVPILLDIMRNVRQSDSARGQGWSGATNLEPALLACRALNYAMRDIGTQLSEIIKLGAVKVLLDCVACFSGSRSPFAAMDLSEEAMQGLELIYPRLYMPSNASLRDSQTDMECIRLLISHVQVCLSFSTGPESEMRGQVPSGGMKGISRALILLRLLLDSHWKIQPISNSSQTPSNFPEKDAVLSALYLAIRHCGTEPEAQTIAALSILLSVVSPRLFHTSTLSDLEPLVTEYDFLAKCMFESTSMTGVQCAAVELVYQLLTCPELCEAALRPPAPICVSLCQLLQSVGGGTSSGGNMQNWLTVPTSISSRNQLCLEKLRSGSGSIGDGMTLSRFNQHQRIGLGLVRLAGLVGFVLSHGFLPPFLKIGDGYDKNKIWNSPGEEVEITLVSPIKNTQIGGENGEDSMAKLSPKRKSGKNKTGQLLAELGNGTCLVCWSGGHESVIPCNRIALRLSFAAQAQMFLTSAIISLTGENKEGGTNSGLSSDLSPLGELATGLMMGGLLGFGGRGKREQPDGLGLNNTSTSGGWSGSQFLLRHFLKHYINQGNLSMVREVIAEGANVNSPFPSGLLPIIMAISCHEQTDVLLELVQALLDGGTDPSIAGEHGTTPLHCSSRLGYTKVVRLLLDAGADINARDDDDRSPLDVCPEEETLLTLISHIDDSESKNMPDVKISDATQPRVPHDEEDVNVEEKEGKYVKQQSVFGDNNMASTSARDDQVTEQEESSYLKYTHPDFYPLQQVVTMKEPAPHIVITTSSKVELGRTLLKSLIIGCDSKVMGASLAPLGKALLTVTLGILQSPLEGDAYQVLLEPKTQSAVLSIVGTLLDNSGCGSSSSSPTTQHTAGRTGLQSQALALLFFTLRKWPESNFKLLDRLGIAQKVSSLYKEGEEADATDPVAVATRAVLHLYNQRHVQPREPEGPNLQVMCSSLMTELMTRNREDIINFRVDQLKQIVSRAEGITPFEALESKLVDILLELSDNTLIQVSTPSLVNLCREILGRTSASYRSQGKTKFSLPFLPSNRVSAIDALLSSGLLVGIGGNVAEPISLQLKACSRNKDIPGACFRSIGAIGSGMLISIAPDTSTHVLRRFLLSHVIFQHPSYVTYCRRIVGKMVRIWGGPLVSGRGQPQWKYHGRNNSQQQSGRERHSGREIHLCQQPFECTTYQVLGFDSITGTHLIKYVPIPMKEEKIDGIPEVPPEGYLQVVLAECIYQVLISDKEMEGSSVSQSLSSHFAVDEEISSPRSDGGNDRSSVGSVRKIQVASDLPVSGERRTESAGIDDGSISTISDCVNHDILAIDTDVRAKILLQDRKDVMDDDDDSSNKYAAGSFLRPQHELVVEEKDSGGVVGCSSSPSSTTSSKHLPQQQQPHCRVWLQLQQSSNPFLWVTGSVICDEEFKLDDAPLSTSLVRKSEIKNVIAFPSSKIWGGKRKDQQQHGGGGNFALLGRGKGSVFRSKQKMDSDETDKQQESDNLLLHVQNACGSGDGDGHVDCNSPTPPHVITPHEWLSSTSCRRGWGLGRLLQPNKGGKMTARQQMVGCNRQIMNEEQNEGEGECERKVNVGANEYELARQGWMQPPVLKLCVKIDTGGVQDHEKLTSAPWLVLEDNWTICKSLGDLWHMSPVTESNHLQPRSQEQTAEMRGGSGILGSRVGKETTGPVAMSLLFDIVIAVDTKMISDVEPLPAAPKLKNAMYIQRGMSREIDSFTKALLILQRLRDLIPPPPILEGSSVAVSNNVDNIGQEETTDWINPQLVDMLSEILEDPVCIGFGAVPCWVDAIFCGGGEFFIPWSMRLEYFRRTAFGPTRGLEWLQASKGITSMEKKIPSNGPPRQESNTNRVKDVILVHRETLIADAEAIMRLYGTVWSGLALPVLGLSTVLEYHFSGEKGLGSGVAASFYTSVAGKLYERGGDSCLGLWVDPERQGSKDEHIFHPNGLFPAPLPSDPDKVFEMLSYFRLIGRLAARCLLDNRLFPLPLSLEFLELALCRAREGTQGPRSLSPTEMKRMYLEPAVVVERLGQAVRKQQQPLELEGEDHGDDGLIDGLSLKDFLDAACLSMVDPIDGSPLEQQHQQQHHVAEKYTPQPAADVNLTNVQEYVDILYTRWSKCGWVKQICTFVEGIRDLFEPSKLLALGARGLSRKLCGEMDFDWDDVSLQKAVIPGAGYTEDSPPYYAFLSLLVTMPLSDKQRFLLFVTGCPALPFGGLCSLSPQLTIMRKQGGMLTEPDSDLPFARTCTHTLHLPPYLNEDIMRERLFYAMDCSADIIDRD